MISDEQKVPILLKEPRGGVPAVIDTPQDFEAALELLAETQGPVAADAERASGFRYGHEDWLVQIKRGEAGIFLFDPVTLMHKGVDFSQLNAVLGSEMWILHDASQDLPGFAELGVKPKLLFDTEFSARLLNLPHVGLSAVTEYFLSRSLAKEHSAADWSYRPLPRDWRNYSALDVELLIPLREKMQEALKAAGKDEWACQEFEAILTNGLTAKVRVKEPWRHTSKITLLRSDRRALAVVRELWNVREKYAKELDISPSLLLHDSTIIQAALRQPSNGVEFKAMRALNQRVRVYTGSEQDKMFERYAPLQRNVKPKVWRQAIKKALELPENELPTAAPPKAHDGCSAPRSMKYWREHQPQRYERLQEMKKIVNQIAEDVAVPAELVIKPKYLRDLCWQEIAPEDIGDFLVAQGARPWQRGLVTESVSRVIL